LVKAVDVSFLPELPLQSRSMFGRPETLWRQPPTHNQALLEQMQSQLAGKEILPDFVILGEIAA